MNRQSELVSKLINPLSELDTSSFAPKQVVLAALTWPTDGWMRIALEWIEQGIPLDEELANALESVSKNKHNAQAIRHKAFAISKRWRRGQS
jgi:hypothetical protein